MPVEDTPTDAESRIIELLESISSGDNRQKRDAEKKSDRTRQKMGKSLKDNALAMVGLTGSMMTLRGMIGNQLSMNAELAKSLGQTANATKGASEATDRFVRGQQGTEQMIKVFGDAVEMGMTGFSNNTMQFGSQLKVLGVQNKTAFQLMRLNTQGLGLVEEASLNLANELVTTAAENKDSISGLMDAIRGMRDAMISTTVELGPKAAMNAQKIAAMMAQGNSELQESSAKFVKSFLAGSSGYIKAAKLGVQFTGEESTSEMARKFETILSRMQGLQAGKQGAGSQFLFDTFEKSFGLSREDFNLQTQIGTDIKELSKGAVERLSADSARISLQQQFWNKTEGFQTGLLKWSEAISKGMDKVYTWLQNLLPEGWKGIADAILPIGAGIASLVGFFAGGTLLAVLGSILGVGGAASVAPAVAGVAGGGLLAGVARAAVKMKSLFKWVLKAVPGVAMLAGVGFGAKRAFEGDIAGALLEVAAGAMTTSMVGAAGAAAIHGGLYVRDKKRDEQAAMVEAMKENTGVLQEISAGVQEGNSFREELTHEESVQSVVKGWRF